MHTFNIGQFILGFIWGSLTFLSIKRVLTNRDYKAGHGLSLLWLYCNTAIPAALLIFWIFTVAVPYLWNYQIKF